MSKFNFKQYAVSTSKPVAYKVIQLDPAPTLMIRPATELNNRFFKAVLKRSRKTMKQQQAGAINAATYAQNREEDAELYSKFVVTGWEQMFDSQGQPVEFSAENCHDFFKALCEDAPDIFDEIR